MHLEVFTVKGTDISVYHWSASKSLSNLLLGSAPYLPNGNLCQVNKIQTTINIKTVNTPPVGVVQSPNTTLSGKQHQGNGNFQKDI